MIDRVLDVRLLRSRPSQRRAKLIEAQHAEEASFVDSDQVVAAASGGAAADLLRVQLIEVAKEAAALKFDRLQLPVGSRESVRLASRRIRALTELARATRELGRIEGSSTSPVIVRRVADLLLDEVGLVLREILDPEIARTMDGEIRRRIDGGLDSMVSTHDPA